MTSLVVRFIVPFAPMYVLGENFHTRTDENIRSDSELDDPVGPPASHGVRRALIQIQVPYAQHYRQISRFSTAAAADIVTQICKT